MQIEDTIRQKQHPRFYFRSTAKQKISLNKHDRYQPNVRCKFERFVHWQRLWAFERNGMHSDNVAVDPVMRCNSMPLQLNELWRRRRIGRSDHFQLTKIILKCPSRPGLPSCLNRPCVLPTGVNEWINEASRSAVSQGGCSSYTTIARRIVCRRAVMFW